jgi:hypothetical protein
LEIVEGARTRSEVLLLRLLGPGLSSARGKDGEARGDGVAVKAALRAEPETLALTLTDIVEPTGLGGPESGSGIVLPTGVRIADSEDIEGA